MSPLTFDIHASKAAAPQSSAARCGTLSTSKPVHGGFTTKRVIETPGCFMYSSKGSVPHLTPDTMRLQDYGGVNVALEQILQSDQPASFSKWPSTPTSPKFTLADYLHLQDLILFCDLRDFSFSESTSSISSDTATRTSKLNPNTDRHVLLSTPKGVRQLTLDDYLKVARQFQPDIIAALADNIVDTKESPQKRVRKSIDRTLKWLDQILVERQGGDGRAADRLVEEEKKRRKESKEKRKTLTKEQQQLQHGQDAASDPVAIQPVSTEPWTDVAVFAHVQVSHFEDERIWSAKETAKRDGVDGFILNANVLLSTSNKEEALQQLENSLGYLPSQKPKLVYGIHAPEDVLKAVALGVDLFDTMYPFQLTEDGKASLFYFGESATPGAVAAASTLSSSNTNRWINLWDDEHGDKFVPILDGCECYACKGNRHTRAYINHLLKTHEMLATVLLMSHNMYQYSRFFAAVREAVKTGTIEQHANAFHKTFGVEPIRTGEKHAAQIIVEAALTKRNQRLETAEPAVVDAIGSGDYDAKKRADSEDDADRENKRTRKVQEKEALMEDVA